MLQKTVKKMITVCLLTFFIFSSQTFAGDRKELPKNIKVTDMSTLNSCKQAALLIPKINHPSECGNIKYVMSLHDPKTNTAYYTYELYSGEIISIKVKNNIANFTDPELVRCQYNGSCKIKTVIRNENAFTMLTVDGRVISHGKEDHGGIIPKAISDLMEERKTKDDPIIQVNTSNAAFAALSKQGRVYVWGNREYGGLITAEMQKKIDGYFDQGDKIVELENTDDGFIIRTTKGKVFIWDSRITMRM